MTIMHILSISIAVASTGSIRGSYTPPNHTNQSLPGLQQFTDLTLLQRGIKHFGEYNDFKNQPSSCAENQIQEADGTCTDYEVTHNVFLVNAPRQSLKQRSNPAVISKPKLNYNIVFVKTPEDPEVEQAIVIPPPEQKTLVYVLNKEKEREEAQVIHMPSPMHKPEVIFVNYKEGENPQLPIGIDLQTALDSVPTLEGQVISGGDSLPSLEGQVISSGDSILASKGEDISGGGSGASIFNIRAGIEKFIAGKASQNIWNSAGRFDAEGEQGLPGKYFAPSQFSPASKPSTSHHPTNFR